MYDNWQFADQERQILRSLELQGQERQARPKVDLAGYPGQGQPAQGGDDAQ